MNNIKIQFPSLTIILTALLCILKLKGVIAISWWWCFCLIWLPFAILFALIGIAIAIAIIYCLITFIIFISTKGLKR